MSKAVRVKKTEHPISPDWVIYPGFSEDYTASIRELQWAIGALGVAIRSHQLELARPVPGLTPQDIESSKVALTVSANNLTACLDRLEEAQAKMHTHHGPVTRALLRCESYDKANP